MRYKELSFSLLLCAAFSFAVRVEGADLEKLLSYDLTELAEMEIVSVSKVRETIGKSPATVRVVTAEQIKERGYQTLEEALSDLPGFQFRDISGFNSYVFMRGLPNQNNLILVLVDGVQINELNSGGFYAGAQYNLGNVKRIEVVYGPASALYGTNAVSGVINIITNDPRDIHVVSGSARAGSSATRAMDFGYGWHNESRDYGVSFSGKLARTDKYGLGGARGDYNWSNKMENFEDDESFDGKLLYKDLTFGVLMQDKNSSRTTNQKTAGTGYLDYGTKWHIRFLNAYLKHVYDRREDWALESTIYYRNATVMDDTVSSIYDGLCSTCGQQGYYRPNDLLGLESRLDLRIWDKAELAVGVLFEKENLAESFSVTYSGDPLLLPASPSDPEMVKNSLVSVYGQGRYDLSPELSFTCGLRRDDSTSYGKVNTPRAGLVYNRQRLALKLLYAEAFRAPKPWDYTYGSGNSDLDPEKMKSMEISGGCALGPHLRADLSLYRNDIRDMLALSGGRYVNFGDIRTSGAEAQVEFAKGKIKSYFSYSAQFSEDENGENVPEIARHSAGAGVLYSFSDKAKLDIRGRYFGAKKNTKVIASTGSDRIGAAMVTDAGFSFSWLKELTLSVMVKNLFDKAYYHTSNIATVDRYRQPGRQILFQLGYSFGFPESD